MSSACDEHSRYIGRRKKGRGRDKKDNGLICEQCSLAHQLLPKHEWTKPEDVRLDRCPCSQHLTGPRVLSSRLLTQAP